MPIHCILFVELPSKIHQECWISQSRPIEVYGLSRIDWFHGFVNESILYFGEYPCLIIFHSVVFNGLMSKVLFQSIHNLDLLESNDDTTAGSTLCKRISTGISRTWSVCSVTWTWWYYHDRKRTLVIIGIMKCNPGSVHEFKRAPPLL